MPKIYVNSDEKRILMHYITHPLQYVKPQYHSYFPGGLCPEHTKITRTISDDSKTFERCFLIPTTMYKGLSHVSIAFLEIDEDDPLEHSCTFVGGKYFFHQDENDLPKIQAYHVEIDSDISDDEDQSEEAAARLKQYRYIQQRLYQDKIERSLKKNYLKDDDEQQLIKHVVKFAVDEDDNDYIIKSTSSFEEQYIPMQLPTIEQPNHFRFFRTTWNGGLRYKRIDIQPNYGPNLIDFLNQTPMTDVLLNSIVRCMLEQYMQQLHTQGIVHTDINLANICIKMTDNGIEIRYVDLDEAYLVDSDPSFRKGKGTPGYYAPELFNNPQDASHQLTIRAQSEITFINALKPDFRASFTQATDIYALGQCLLHDVKVPEDSPYCELILRMCDEDLATRATGEDIEHVLKYMTPAQPGTAGPR
jgi:hypothetical protein